MIGLAHFRLIHQELKRNLLLYDRIKILELSRHNLERWKQIKTLPEETKWHYDELLWLLDQKLIEEHHGTIILGKDNKPFDLGPEFEKINNNRIKYSKLLKFDKNDLENKKNWKMYSSLALRLESITQNYLSRINQAEELLPILPFQNFYVYPSLPNKSEVMHILIDGLPIPDDSVSWETILDFKNNTESRGKLLAIKRWVNKISKESLGKGEIKDEIEYLIHEYEQSIKLHRMKTNMGMIETVLTIPAEILENLVQIKFSKAIQSCFVFKKRRIQLLEAEMRAGGRELAYIVKAREKFS